MKQSKNNKEVNAKIPFVEIDLSSRFYKDSHREWYRRCEEFGKKYMTKQAMREAFKGYDPKSLALYYTEGNIWSMPPPDMRKRCVEDFQKYGGIVPEDCDYFHMMLWIIQCGTYCGITSGVLYVSSLAAACIFRHGSERLKGIIGPDLIQGRAIAALAISEPGGGSDVANLKLEAKLEGDEWVLNGEKYYITNGLTCKFLSVACRTGKKGVKGISFIMVPRDTKGIFGSRMNIQSGKGNDTAYLTFKNVRVPKENLIGIKNMGFYYIMESFNHERFGIACQSIAQSRICIAESIAYGRERKTFGKRLIDHQVIRHKIVNMARHYLSTLAWTERICEKLAMGVDMRKIGAECAMLKVDACRTAEHCAREARQVFGGRGVVQGGRGGRVEVIARQVGPATVYGGSEEILVDLAGRLSKL